MTLIPKKSSIHKSQHPYRRTILGHRVLVGSPRGESDNSVVPVTFSVRIKDPDHGDRDFTCPAFFYWQAFNEARRLITCTKTQSL